MKKVMAFVLWAACGVSSLMYDAAGQFDLHVSDCVACVFFGVPLGPFALIMVGVDELAAHTHDVIVIRKRH